MNVSPYQIFLLFAMLAITAASVLLLLFESGKLRVIGAVMTGIFVFFDAYAVLDLAGYYNNWAIPFAALSVYVLVLVIVRLVKSGGAGDGRLNLH